MSIIATKIKKNCMGTISFDIKLAGMRKEQDFIVYPNPQNGIIQIQSNDYWGEIIDGVVTFYRDSSHSNSWDFSLAVSQGKTKKCTIENWQELRERIIGSAGALVGDYHIVCDNSGAASI